MKLKRILAVLLAAVMFVSVFAMQASAQTISVSLLPSENWVSSASMTAKQVKANGTNHSISKHYVYFQFYCRKTTDAPWSKNEKKYMKPGTSFSDLKSTAYDTTMLWCYQLNATGLYKNCSATGTYWNIL